MDYNETFAPVTKMTTICTLIVIASVRQWHISKMDVNNAFLNRDLKEKVYMDRSLGVPHGPGKDYKLKKVLYSLKQVLEVGLRSFPL